MSFVQKRSVFLITTLLWITQWCCSQSLIGRWKTVDDETGKEKGVVEIYEINGVYYAKIVEIFEEQHKNKKCVLCSGDDKDKPFLGLVIIRGLKKSEGEFNGGTVLDPKNGKQYKCYIKFENNDKIKIRGYIGVPLLGRTQYWYRVKNSK